MSSVLLLDVILEVLSVGSGCGHPPRNQRGIVVGLVMVVVKESVKMGFTDRQWIPVWCDGRAV